MEDIIGRPAEVINIPQSETVVAAASKMHTHKVGCLIVHDENVSIQDASEQRDVCWFRAHIRTSFRIPGHGLLLWSPVA